MGSKIEGGGAAGFSAFAAEDAARLRAEERRKARTMRRNGIKGARQWGYGDTGGKRRGRS